MTPDTPDTTGGDVTLNTVFSALSHQARRSILAKIRDPPPQHVGGFDLEYFVEREAIPERTNVELYHNHLPKLDAAGFVDWDPQSNTVSRGPATRPSNPCSNCSKPTGRTCLAAGPDGRTWFPVPAWRRQASVRLFLSGRQ